MENTYADKALEEIPRLLSTLDRNPFSPTYGCFNREFWLTRVKDFPDAIAQFGTLSLALIYSYKFPNGEKYYKNAEIKKWTIAGIRYWIHIQHKDGSFDEFYPNERGWAGPTGFLLYAMIKSRELLMNQFPKKLESEFLDAVKKSALFLATRDEDGVLANHHAMALLPIMAAINYIDKHDAQYANKLRNLFDSRMRDFLSYCKEEGWSLEYDGADPGYLSATVSFLSKMQKYSKNDEWWSQDIKKVINKAIDFSSYFLYPNGSYAGTIGSRQTLHFYAHGYELQAKENPLAASLAHVAEQSLFNGKIVPPSIQDDRYFTYRIPEFLESFMDRHRTNNYIKIPYQQNPFTKYFPEAKIFIQNTDNNYIVVNLAKGGVIKIFNKKSNKLIFADDGIILATSAKDIYTSQWINPKYKIFYHDNNLVVEGPLNKIPYKYFTPISMVAFRLFMIVFANNAKIADMIKGLIRKLLMTKSKTSSTQFTRNITLSNSNIIIKDTINIPQRIDNIRIGGQFAARYVPQSRYFQEEELENDYLYKNKNDLVDVLGETTIFENNFNFNNGSSRKQYKA